jgi:ribosomal subunit interface protein
MNPTQSSSIFINALGTKSDTTAMEIHYKVTHAKEKEDDISSKAIAFAERKIRNLKKYLGKKSEELDIQVYVELGKNTDAHQTGPMIWRAQINLDSRGEKFHASAIAERIEVAISSAVGDLEQELRKRKAQRKNLLKRGGTTLKSLMRGFSL